MPVADRGRRALVAAAAAGKKQKQHKPQRPKQRRHSGPRVRLPERIYLDEAEDGADGVVPVVLTTKTPAAPPPTDQQLPQTPRPEDLYPVFPQQQSAAVSRLPADSEWSWGGEQPATGGAAPSWNPRTGFMKTRAELEQQPASASSSSSSTSAPASGQNAAAGDNDGSSSSWVQRLPDSPRLSAVQQLTHLSPTSTSPPPTQSAPPAAVSTALPSVSREEVLRSCLASSAAMVAAAALLRVFAQAQAPQLLGTDPALVEQLLQLPAGLQSWDQVGIMLAAAGAVTGARLLLLQQWPDFRAASEASNQQVLAPLGWPDVVLVALLTGASEELLFRGALIPATLPDGRGVLLAGLVFGALHVSGGRNLAFAAWASAVGWLYGGLFLATGNVWVPASAHSLANFASATLWMTKSNRK